MGGGIFHLITMSPFTVLIAIAALLACTAYAQRPDDPLRGLWSKIEAGSAQMAEDNGIPYLATTEMRVRERVRKALGRKMKSPPDLNADQ
jgi:hypothetical protein